MKILIFFTILCIVSEAIIIICKEKAWSLRYMLFGGSFPILIYSFYSLRFLLRGIEGMQEHFSTPHISHLFITICLTIAAINFLTYQIILDLKKGS